MTPQPNNADNSLLDSLVTYASLDDMLNRASAGDTHAAKAVLASIAHYLHPESIDGLSLSLRAYLSEAFYKMANGEDARHALNLTRNGRPNYSHKLKMLIAYGVYQLVHESHLAVLEAAGQIAENINANLDDGRFYELESRPITCDTTRNWYIELKGEIDMFYSLALKQKLHSEC
jgi:hypothetical protein